MLPARARPVSLTIGRGAWPAGSWFPARGTIDMPPLDCAAPVTYIMIMTTTTRTLYRAADDDYLSDCASFAADRDDAEQYLDNPGFGGSTLWQTEVEVDDDQVLDIRSSRDDDQVQSLLSAIESDREPCGATVDVLMAEPSTVEALVARGYLWVRLTDSYPEGAETWTWLGAGDEPELTEC